VTCDAIDPCAAEFGRHHRILCVNRNKLAKTAPPTPSCSQEWFYHTWHTQPQINPEIVRRTCSCSRNYASSIYSQPTAQGQGGIWGRSQWGGVRQVVSPTFPFPSPFPFPLSFQTNQWEGRSDPVRGKFPGLPPYKYHPAQGLRRPCSSRFNRLKLTAIFLHSCLAAVSTSVVCLLNPLLHGLLFINWPWQDGRLSWPCWRTV